VLTGSRGYGPYARDDSDWDVRLVVRDPSARETYRAERGDALETVVMTPEQLENVAEWDRYSYVHAQVVIDKGGIAALVAAIGTVAPDVAAASLDDYINSYLRSAKNAKLGLVDAARLDAGESVSPFLTALFALHGRVRPFNKYLRWELEELPIAGWDAGALLERLARVAAADLPEQQKLFRDIERVARECGHGDVVDSWEPDVPFLRGE
jgi:hypothetical protein